MLIKCLWCCVRGVVYTVCSPCVMLSISACPGDCESCYLDDTTPKCLMSGCKQGFARKTDKICVGKFVPVRAMEAYLLCIRTSI